MSPSRRPAVGDVYKRELLHSEATYRVVGVQDGHVEVEAVDVPGLPAGFRMRLTDDAIETMALIGEAPAGVEAGAREDRAAERRLGLASS
jgi:hypothetical protein